MSDLEKRLREALTAKADAVDIEPTSSTKEQEFLSQLHQPVRHRQKWWLGGAAAAAACGVVALAVVQGLPADNGSTGSAVGAAASAPTTTAAPGATQEKAGTPGMSQLPARPNDSFTVPGATVIGPSEVAVTVDGRQLIFRPVISLLRGRLTVAGELSGPAYVSSRAPSFPYAWSVSTPNGGFVEDAALGCADTTRREVDATRTFGSWSMRGAGTVTLEAAVCAAPGKTTLLRWTGQVVPRPYG